ncbi:hypothetical protein KGF57_004342 [Candida theae]|uniref:Uncharacterized protein n=1 Tax=Candida theae TaxID=1198502 RepID=A0AAD5FX13_9ASCO|nr:uncharacterized protein KGF57_004342 [Candida theae]KAI5950379.1 hypothetical protein KGF57_004342 [Candida theae]
MSFQLDDYRRPIEEEEFDDTELETPVRLNTSNIKQTETANGLYRSFRASGVNYGATSNLRKESGLSKEAKSKTGNDKGSPIHKNAKDPDILTIGSPPSLKFDKSISLDEKHKQRLKNHSPTPVTRLKPPTSELSPVDHSPVSYKVAKPSIERKGDGKDKARATETPLSKIRHDDEAKQSILDRVNTTLESIKRTEPNDEGIHATTRPSDVSPAKARYTRSNDGTVQPSYDFEVDEPDFVHAPSETAQQPEKEVPHSRSEQLHLNFDVHERDDVLSRPDVNISPIHNDNTLGNSTPLSNRKENSVLHDERNRNLNRNRNRDLDRETELEFQLGGDSTTWWTATQWSKLMKVVNSKVVSRKDAINSQLLMKELGCSSKEDLQRRYDFLKYYRNK